MQNISIFSLLFIAFTSQVFGKVLSHNCLDRQEVYGQMTTVHLGASEKPTIAVNPKNKNEIVACWQQDRIDNGGALDAGISYSKDGGKTWHSTKVPFQVCDGGIVQRISDVSLSFCPNGRRVYLSAHVLNATTDVNTQNQEGIVVTSSQDGGVTWGHIRFVAASQSSLVEPTKQFAQDNKSIITADPVDQNIAYIVWNRFNRASSLHSTTQICRTTDGGKTWGAHTLMYNPFPDLNMHKLSNGIENDCSTWNNVILRLPKLSSKPWKKDNWGNLANKRKRLKGDLLNFMVRKYARPASNDSQYAKDSFPFQHTLFDIALVRSQDQGATWEKNAQVVVPAAVNNFIFSGGYSYGAQKQITAGVGTLLRGDKIAPSYAVNRKNGFLYVVYETGQFREDHLSQIALTSSRDGGYTWTKPVKISRTPNSSHNPQAFTPFVAVTDDGQVGVLYFDMREGKKSHPSKTPIDAYLAIYKEVRNAEEGSTGSGSTGIGLDFVSEIKLSEKSYVAQNGPMTIRGNVVDSDNPFLLAFEDHFYAIYTKTMKGPFEKIEPFYADPENNAIVFLDNNVRQVPFVSIIKCVKGEKIKLISTSQLPSITSGTNVK